MRLVVNQLEQSSTQATWTLHHLTDLHCGARGHDRRGLEARVKEIAADPHGIWVGGGDYGDLILPSDRRYHPGMLPEDYAEHEGRLVDWMLNDVASVLKPIASQCVGFGVGNHEQTIAKHYGRGVGDELARMLDIRGKYLGYRGWGVLKFSRGRANMPVTFYQHHGWSGGRLKGRKALQAERELGQVDADIIMCGHDHQPDYRPWLTQELYGSKLGYRIRNRQRCTLNGGSWVGHGAGDVPIEPVAEHAYEATDEMWAATKNFRAEPMGGPRVLIHVDFGNSVSEASNATGRAAGYTLKALW